jgi:hypothetical protein
VLHAFTRLLGGMEGGIPAGGGLHGYTRSGRLMLGVKRLVRSIDGDTSLVHAMQSETRCYILVILYITSL